MTEVGAMFDTAVTAARFPGLYAGTVTDVFEHGRIAGERALGLRRAGPGSSHPGPALPALRALLRAAGRGEGVDRLRER